MYMLLLQQQLLLPFCHCMLLLRQQLLNFDATCTMLLLQAASIPLTQAASWTLAYRLHADQLYPSTCVC